jgi:hypothetical protein
VAQSAPADAPLGPWANVVTDRYTSRGRSREPRRDYDSRGDIKDGSYGFDDRMDTDDHAYDKGKGQGGLYSDSIVHNRGRGRGNSRDRGRANDRTRGYR